MPTINIPDKNRINLTINAALILSLLVLGGKALMSLQAMQDRDEAIVNLIDNVRADHEFGMQTLGEEIEELDDRLTDAERAILRHNPRGTVVHTNGEAH